MNAAKEALGEDPVIFSRTDSYIGVMIDDLTSRGVSEPYRMFTSRAEYRLSLREDNADLRLTEKGRELGLVDDERWAAFSAKRDGMAREEQRLKNTWVHPKTPEAEAVNALIEKPLTHEYSLMDLLKRPELSYAGLADAVALDDRPDSVVIEQMEILAKYSGYIDRQTDEIEKLRAAETSPLPADFDYEQVKGLSNEVKQKLGEVRPETLGQAGRIPGVTPAAISLLMIYLKKHQHQQKAAQQA